MIFALAASPLIGSFIANFVARFPTEQSVFSGRSACPHCACQLAVRDLVPLLSWLLSSGRCRHCRRPIAAFYPLIELAAVAVALVAAAVTSGWLLWVTCGLGWTLLALAAVDFRHFVLPDALTLPLIPAGLAVAYLQEPAELMTHVIGALAGYLLFLLVRELYFRLRAREGLGLGESCSPLAAFGGRGRAFPASSSSRPPPGSPPRWRGGSLAAPYVFPIACPSGLFSVSLFGSTGSADPSLPIGLFRDGWHAERSFA